MAVKIRLKRIGKKFSPVYRVVVLDARKKRDGRVMQEPSLIRIDSERARYWLGVGAQPSDTVHRLLKITGDYQAFKGLPVPEGKLRLKDESAAARARLDAIRLADDDAQKRKAAASAQAQQAEQVEQAGQAQEAGSEVVEGV